MRFLNVRLHNFGVYRGENHFDLVGNVVDLSRNVTLFYGRNGAGKSTLFKAIQIALHGSLALGTRISKQTYTEYINRYIGLGAEQDSKSLAGSIAVEFEYVRSGVLNTVKISRSWTVHGLCLVEELELSENGVSVTTADATDHQQALQERIFSYLPPVFSRICFFDAEQLDSLASPEQHNAALAGLIDHFLGLDLTKRLQADLHRHILSVGEVIGTSELRDQIRNIQEARDALEDDIAKAKVNLNDASSRRQALFISLREAETKLAVNGGNYANIHEQLISDKAEAERLLIQSRLEMNELWAGLLPFAVIPELLAELAVSLRQEAERAQKQLAFDALVEAANRVESLFKDTEFRHDCGLTDYNQAVVERILKAIRGDNSGINADDAKIIHSISEAERSQLQRWIESSLNDIPIQATELLASIKTIESELVAIEKDLSQVPDEIDIAPLHATVEQLTNQVAEAETAEAQANDELKILESKAEELDNELENLGERLLRHQSAEHNLQLAYNSRLVLKTYQDVLLRQRLRAIEEELSNCFRNICHKENLIRSVVISPDDFSVEVIGADDKPISLGQISSGERQLYVMSLLWALRKVSGRDLPLFIDTPVARLDEGHGWQLIHEYFPEISRQVVLFATNKEMDQGLLDIIEPYIVKAYELGYSENEHATQYCEPIMPVTGMNATLVSGG